MRSTVTRDIAAAASVPLVAMGNMEVIAAESALRFIDASSRWDTHRIVAVEGFRALLDGRYQPDMDWILDLSPLSDPTQCRQEAREFVGNAPPELYFAFDLA